MNPNIFTLTHILDVDHALEALGRLAQMVERSLSMREAPGSIPGFSNLTATFFFPWKQNGACFSRLLSSSTL